MAARVAGPDLAASSKVGATFFWRTLLFHSALERVGCCSSSEGDTKKCRLRNAKFSIASFFFASTTRLIRRNSPWKQHGGPAALGHQTRHHMRTAAIASLPMVQNPRRSSADTKSPSLSVLLIGEGLEIAGAAIHQVCDCAGRSLHRAAAL